MQLVSIPEQRERPIKVIKPTASADPARLLQLARPHPSFTLHRTAPHRALATTARRAPTRQVAAPCRAAPRPHGPGTRARSCDTPRPRRGDRASDKTRRRSQSAPRRGRVDPIEHLLLSLSTCTTGVSRATCTHTHTRERNNERRYRDWERLAREVGQ